MICNICKEEVNLQKAKDKDEICPNCKSTSDERLFYQEIEKHLQDNMNILLLNETTILKDNIIKNYSINYHHATEETLNEVPEPMDIIVSNYFIDNVKNEVITLNKLTEILKDDGILILKENTDLELDIKIEDCAINISENPKTSRLFYGREGSKRVFGNDLITVLESKFYVSYEDPQKQENNLLLKDRLTKDPLITCKLKPKEEQKSFEINQYYSTYEHNYSKDNIESLLKKITRKETNEIAAKSEIDHKFSQIKSKANPISEDIGEIECNVCNYRTNLEFLRSNGKSNERCPRCKSLSQSRTLAYYLKNYTDIFTEKRIILHTSEDEGLIELIDEYQGFNYISANTEEKKLNKEIMDFENIPYHNDTFDYIISSTLLNTPDINKKILEEFNRVLKKEGKIILISDKEPSLETFKETNFNLKCYDLKKDHENEFIEYNLSDDLIYVGTKLD